MEITSGFVYQNCEGIPKSLRNVLQNEMVQTRIKQSN